MKTGGHQSLFLTKNFKRTKVAIFSRTLWCYCEIFFVLSKYNCLLNKIMNPELVFHIFKVKYLKVIY